MVKRLLGLFLVLALAFAAVPAMAESESLVVMEGEFVRMYLDMTLFEVSKVMALPEKREVFVTSVVIDGALELEGFSIEDIQRVYIATVTDDFKDDKLVTIVFFEREVWSLSVLSFVSIFSMTAYKNDFTQDMTDRQYLIMDALVDQGQLGSYHEVPVAEILSWVETLTGNED